MLKDDGPAAVGKNHRRTVSYGRDVVTLQDRTAQASTVGASEEEEEVSLIGAASKPTAL